MSTVNSRRGPGRPPLRNQEKGCEIIRACLRAAITTGEMPKDTELGERFGLGERTVRTIRLEAGLNRRDVASWVKGRGVSEHPTTDEGMVCFSPFAGLWLIAPLIVGSVLLSASNLLRWSSRTSVAARSWVLTVLMWAILGFRRFFHLEEFRHAADLGLALFTGRMRILSDSIVWRLVHTLKPKSAEAFYHEVASEAIPLDAPTGEEWVSMDEHVVGFFTKLKPRPLEKTRVPTRGRSYPAIRLYAPFHLWAGRFIGLVVAEAHKTLSQIVPDLICEVRRLRQKVSHPHPQKVDLIIDRGGYKGSLFEELIDDTHIRFIAMARATKSNVRQWEGVLKSAFKPYQPEGETNPNLKIAQTKTEISHCRHPLRTILIRDDTPDTKQRWRTLFTNVPTHKMTPADVDATYRRRQGHENSFADLDHNLSGKCLPKPYSMVREKNDQGEKRKTVATTLSEETMTGLKVISWLRHFAFNMVKDFGKALGDPYASMRVGTLIRKFIARPGVLSLRDNELWVVLMPFSGSEALADWIHKLNQQRVAIPWLGRMILQVEIAPLPVGLAANPRAARQRIFANRPPPMVS